jgi:hypothetical protein
MEGRAEEAAQEFIDLEKNTARVQMMNYHLGEYYFRRQQFGDAARQYDLTNIENLSNREIADMKFHQGIVILPCKDLPRLNRFSMLSGPSRMTRTTSMQIIIMVSCHSATGNMLKHYRVSASLKMKSPMPTSFLIISRRSIISRAGRMKPSLISRVNSKAGAIPSTMTWNLNN